MMARGNGTQSQLAPRQETEIVGADGEVFDFREAPTALEAITRAEIDIQIATAKRFPRSMSRFLAEAKTMVAVDPDLAAQCTYYLPKRSDKGQPISGPSVRLAEIMAVCWGNLRVVGRITDDDGKFVTAQAVAIDLERNVGYSVEVKRGVTTKNGARYGDDMIKTTCNAAIAIATRNVTFKVIPRAFVSLVEEAAQLVARGDVKSLPDRTERAVGWFVGKGVEEAAVYKALGIGGAADMTLDLLTVLNGYKTAVNEDRTTLAELFSPAAEFAPPAPPTGSKADKLAGKLAEREPSQDG